MANTFIDSTAEKQYDSILELPIVRTIRKQESEILYRMLDQELASEDTVLEIGAGTGYYTKYISNKVKSVDALETSAQLAGILKNKSLPSVNVIRQDFFDHSPELKYDHVLAFGVLDYVADGKAFVEKCLAHTNKSVILTAPQTGLWSDIYKFISKLNSVKIYSYAKDDFNIFSNNTEIMDTGLKTVFTKGMTLIIKINNK